MMRFDFVLDENLNVYLMEVRIKQFKLVSNVYLMEVRIKQFKLVSNVSLCDYSLQYLLLVGLNLQFHCHEERMCDFKLDFSKQYISVRNSNKGYGV